MSIYKKCIGMFLSISIVLSMFTGVSSFAAQCGAEPESGDSRQEDLREAGLGNVVLDDGYLKNASRKEIAYLLKLSPENFLNQFYVVSGITPPSGSKCYGGWEKATGSNFKGHTLGHYLTALSQAYASGTTSSSDKARLLKKIKTTVNGLKECQDANATKGLTGYVSAFDESRLNIEEGGTGKDRNTLVPYYILHKILAGLISVSENVKEDSIGQTALEVAEGLGDYLYNRVSKWTEGTKKRVLRTEYGGMNDALYELYRLTGNDHYKKAAEHFDETALFDKLEKADPDYYTTDLLAGLHANCTIPKIIGALNRYVATGETDKYYLTVAEHFFDIVKDHHTYVVGGNSEDEHFKAKDKLASYADNTNDETCNTYNMLKLARMLFMITKDKEYADYYEDTFINAIMASQDPETGMTTYFQAMAPGYYKVFSTPENNFWCCTGTGMENFSKLGDSIYFPGENSVYVNLFFSSEFTDKTRNLKLKQTADLPNSNQVSFTVDSVDGGAVAGNTALYVRIPDWAASAPILTVNGKSTDVTKDGNGCIELSNVHKGDKFKLSFPMKVVSFGCPDNPNMVAFKYGPVVLSCGLGKQNMVDQSHGIGVRVASPDISVNPYIKITNGQSVGEWLKNISQNLVRISDSSEGKVQFALKGTNRNRLVYSPYYSRYTDRYGIYMYLITPDDHTSQDLILKQKQSDRLKDVSSDSITVFDNNNTEKSKGLQCSSNSSVGTYGGRMYRDAKKDGWFSYKMKLNPKAVRQYLCCTYTKADKGRSFEIDLNGTKFVTETLDPSHYHVSSDGFYTVEHLIPENLLADSNGNRLFSVTVKFASTGGLVGGLYGLRISTDYDTNPNLSGLTFNTGTLDRAFDGKITEYTLRVPTTAVFVKMTAKVRKPGALVYDGDVLIDDSKSRFVRLKGDQTDLELTSMAQDETTSKKYIIHIVKKAKMASSFAALNPKVKVQNVSNGTPRAFINLPALLQATVNGKKEIIGVINWAPKPAYSPFKSGAYVFTAVLPEGYACASGVKLPSITVHVAPVSGTVSKEKLQLLYNFCKKVEKGNYTYSSWSAFTSAMNQAKNVLSNKKATQSMVNQAEVALNRAKNGLLASSPSHHSHSKKDDRTHTNPSGQNKAPETPARRESFRSDTSGTYHFSRGAVSYCYKIVTTDTIVPAAASSNPAVASVAFAGKLSDGYLFKITNLGTGSAVITTTAGDGTKTSFSVQGTGAAGGVVSDTPYRHEILKGKTYQFKFTVTAGNGAPAFSTGNSRIARTVSVRKVGNTYYYTVEAVSGGSAGVYVTFPGLPLMRKCVISVS